MTDTDIRIALDRATDGLEPPADLLDRARHGGRRRLRHRRAALGSGLAVALVAATVAAIAGPPDLDAFPARPPASEAAHPADLAAVMDRPTGGDLAGDQAFLTLARESWTNFQMSNLFENETLAGKFDGPPKVLWAGNTRAGRGAFVAQWERRPNPTPMVRVGFLEPGAGGSVGLRQDDVMTAGVVQQRPPAVLLGERRDTLVVLDTGGRVDMSKTYTLGPDGRVRRSFEPLIFTGGVAIVGLPPQVDEFTVALALPGGVSPPGGPLTVTNYGGLARPDDSRPAERLSRKLADGVFQNEAKLPVGWTSDPWTEFGDPPGRHTAAADPEWFITTDTPDGRLLAVQTLQYGHGPRRIIYGLGPQGSVLTPTFGGTVEPGGPLDVRLRLPAGQGVLVAAKGATLRHRSGKAAWQAVPGDTALLPAATTGVEVTRPGATPVTVELP
jgi:hypothetical protein